MLSRDEEVAQARKPGQGRRETVHCMREATEGYATPQHTHTNATDPSSFGAAEHENTSGARTPLMASPEIARDS